MARDVPDGMERSMNMPDATTIPLRTLLTSVLRDACQRALDPDLPDAGAIRLFHAVVALARTLRQARTDANADSSQDPIRPENAAIAALLSAVLTEACGPALMPDLPLGHRIGLHRAVAPCRPACRSGRSPGVNEWPAKAHTP